MKQMKNKERGKGVSINLSFDYYFKEIVIKMKGRAGDMSGAIGWWTIWVRQSNFLPGL